MPVQDIIELGNSLLGEQCSPVDEPTSASVSELVNDLKDTLEYVTREHGFGRGIAAPQIGALKRVIYINLKPDGFEGALTNPEIADESPERYEMWDGCFCFPRLLVRVTRATDVRAGYVDTEGNPQTLEATGELAAVLQHEIDHLNGVLAVERAVSSRAYMSRGEWERQGRPF
ncbi:MAG: peptide deformylase [Candidatus Eisenbacteria bacterium]